MPPLAPRIIDLNTISASDGFSIHGMNGTHFSASSAGDINGDGIDDLIFGDPLVGHLRRPDGEAYVIFGRSTGFSDIDVNNLSADDGFVIQAEGDSVRAGFSVSSAGDINGDGIDDMIIGDPSSWIGPGDSGAAHVIFGRSTGFSDINMSSLSASDGFVIHGRRSYDSLGNSVSSAGDINGDGFDDMIIGARWGKTGGNYAGEAYVIFGHANGFSEIDVGNLSASDGFMIQGYGRHDQAGTSVSSAGDINGDGFDDMLVGAPHAGGDREDHYGDHSGEAYVIYGHSGDFSTIELSNLSSSDGFVIQGAVEGDQAGQSVSSAGDINGDGIDDLIIGGRDKAHVIFGHSENFSTIDLSNLSAEDGFVIQGGALNARTGWSVSSAGDTNGDGIDDLIVLVPGGDNGNEAYVVFGRSTGFSDIDLNSFSATDGFIIQGADSSVASAGDINNDGIDDLIIGTKVIYGQRPTLAVTRDGTDIDQSIFGGHLDDTLNGHGGDDVLDGGDGADKLNGGTGDDTLRGGNDTDTAIFSGNRSGYTIRYDSGSGLVTVEDSDLGNGDDGTDTLIDMEFIEFADETITVGGAANRAPTGGVGVKGTATQGATLSADTNSLSDADGLGAFSYQWLRDGSEITGATGSSYALGQGDVGDQFSVRVSYTDGLGTNESVTSGQTATAVGVPFRGDATNNLIIGNDEANTIWGLRGDDILSGRNGRDKLIGGAGDDFLLGDDGNDVLKGGKGDDVLNGGKGRDILKGGKGHDILNGDSGNDKLVGGGGRDVLNGGAGNDRMTGGAGGDTFVFSQGDDVITDFNGSGNRERIDLNGVSSIIGFRDLINNHVTDKHGNVVINDGDGNTLKLIGLAIDDLNANDFLF